MISLIELSKPPGVFRDMMMSEALSFSAFSIALMIYSEVMGWMGALTVIFRMAADAMSGQSPRNRNTRIFLLTVNLL